MQKKLLVAIILVFSLSGAEINSSQGGLGEFFAGQDLHLGALRMTVYKSGYPERAEQILVFEGGFSLTIGANQLLSDSAVVWLETIRSDYLGNVRIDYNAQVYLEGNVSIQQGNGALTTDLGKIVVEQGEALVSRFFVSGEVYAKAQSRAEAQVAELLELRIYQNAIAALEPVAVETKISNEEKRISEDDVIVTDESEQPNEKVDEQPAVKEVDDIKVKFEYPINLNALWEPGPEIIRSPGDDGKDITTVTGRFYLWQKQDEKGARLEFQADNAVIFHSDGEFKVAVCLFR